MSFTDCESRTLGNRYHFVAVTRLQLKAPVIVDFALTTSTSPLFLRN